MACRQRPERCDLYLPGHHAHWIQLRKASAERHRWGRLVAVDDDVITVSYLDGVGRYRNHRVQTLSTSQPPAPRWPFASDFGPYGLTSTTGRARASA